MDDLPQQELSPLGGLVTGMILRTLRARFHHLELLQRGEVPRQAIFVANHNGWHDGYVMFALARHLRRPVLDWIAEYHAFPLFELVGGMPFPADDPAIRARTIRQTVRQMRSEGRSLLLFAEGTLHAGPHLLSFGRSLELVARQVPEARVVPVAIRYSMVFHERPVATLIVGEPLPTGENLTERAQAAVAELLRNPTGAGQTFFLGTRDVNERMKVPPTLVKVFSGFRRKRR